MASNAIKRQRKRRRIDTDGDPEFQVAPMVDVLLVLMLFFMAITSTEVLKKNKNLTLAEAKHAQNPASYVVIRADKDVEYSNIADLMTACASAGVGTVTFAVISGGATGS